MKPKVCTVVVVVVVAFVVAYGRSRSVGWRRARPGANQSFERFEFRCETGNVRAEFVVILFRRLVAAGNAVDHSGHRIDFLLFRFLAVHQLLLVADPNGVVPPLRRLLLLLLMRHVVVVVVVNGRRIGTHPHSLRSRLLLLLLVGVVVMVVMVRMGGVRGAAAAGAAAAAEPRGTSRQRPIAARGDSGIAFVTRLGRTPSAAVVMQMGRAVGSHVPIDQHVVVVHLVTRRICVCNRVARCRRTVVDAFRFVFDVVES